MFPESQFVAIKNKNNPLTCLLIGIWLNNLWYLDTTEYYVAVKRNDVKLFVLTTQKSLEDSFKSEREKQAAE